MNLKDQHFLHFISKKQTFSDPAAGPLRIFDVREFFSGLRPAQSLSQFSEVPASGNPLFFLSKSITSAI